jgi:hypothetical protein
LDHLNGDPDRLVITGVLSNAFNANKPVDEQSQNWRVGGSGGFALEREETPKEAPETKQLINACMDYYQNGKFPEGLVSSTVPSLVTSELTPKVIAAQQQAQAEQREAEQRVYQDVVSRNFGSLGNIR